MRRSCHHLLNVCAFAVVVALAPSCLFVATNAGPDAAVDPEPGTPPPDDAGALLDGGRVDAGNGDGGQRGDAGSDGGPLDVDAGLDAGLDAGPFLDGGDAGVFNDGGVIQPADAGMDDTCLQAPLDESGFRAECGAFYDVFGVSPALLSSTPTHQGVLRIHGRFVPDEEITVTGYAEFGSPDAPLLTAAGSVDGSERFVDISLFQGASFVGRLEVFGSIRGAYGDVWVNIRPHSVVVGNFAPVLPQAMAGKRFGQLSEGGETKNVRPFRTKTGLFCGAGGDEATVHTCHRTDVDGSVREPLANAGTPLLADPRRDPAVVYAGNRIYVIGGRVDGAQVQQASTRIESAVVGPSGAISQHRREESLSQPRTKAAALLVGDQLCVFGGENAIGESLDSIECALILPDGLGAFFLAGQMIEPRSGVAAAVVNGQVLLSGGRGNDGSFIQDFVEVAPASSPFAFAEVNASSGATARGQPGVVVVDETAYLISGEISNGLSDSIIELDVGDTGTVDTRFRDAAVPENMTTNGAAVVGNYIYIGPSEGDTGKATPAAVASVVNANSIGTPERSSEGGSLNLAFSTSALVNDSLYSIGGTIQPEGTSADAIRVRLSTTGTVVSVSNQPNVLPRPRSHACALVVDDRILVVGGRERDPGGTFEPNSVFVLEVTSGGSLAFVREIPNALPSGRRGPTCHIIDDTAFVVGGMTASLADFSVLSGSLLALANASDGNTNAILTPMATNFDRNPRWMQTSIVVDKDSIDVFPGIRSNDQCCEGNSLKLTGVASGTLAISGDTQITNPIVSVSARAIPLADRTLVVGGGYFFMDTVSTGALINRGNSTSSNAGQMFASPVRGHASVLVGANIVTATGRTEDAEVGLPVQRTQLRGD